MLPIYVIFIGFYSAVVSLCLSARQVFSAPVPDTNFIIAQVVLIGIVIVCLVIGAKMNKVREEAEQKTVESREIVASASDDMYWAEIFKSNIYGDDAQTLWVRVNRLGGGREIFRLLLVDDNYGEKDALQYLKLARYLSQGGAPSTYNKPKFKKKWKPIGEKK